MTGGELAGGDRDRSAGRVARRRSAGFTLIELMIALLISSLLVGMILAIFSRMSLAYRGQQQIAGVQQVLAAAGAAIDLDAKQAGFAMAQGFTSQPTEAAGKGLQSPVQVTDGGGGPDELRLFYADPTAQSVVVQDPVLSGWPAGLDIDPDPGPFPPAAPPTRFVPGDLIALVNADTATVPSPIDSTEANITQYTTCVAQISAAPGSVGSGSPVHLVLETAGPWGWGTAGDGPCAKPPTAHSTMVYRFVAHAYHIDTSTSARAGLGPLQQSQTGGLLGDAEVWNDIAYGFTDLQTALRVYQKAAAVDLDGDGDPQRDWYSGANQSTLNPAPPNDSLIQISISLVARTDRDIEGISTLTTPELVDLARPDNNPLGNRAAIALPTKPPWLTDPALQGSRIYRYVTFQVDFRNLGVGR